MKTRRLRPLAIFDIDGTIFRSSLLIELNAKLVQEGVFPEAATEEVSRVREAWLNRTGSYQSYIDTIVRLYLRDIKGKKVSDIEAVSKQVIAEQKHRVYVFTRELIKRLRRTHTLVIISFSPSEVVREFKRVYRFDLAQGIEYERTAGRYTGRLAPGTVIDKKQILLGLIRRHGLDLEGSVGVGDTETDADFFKLVGRPIAFNPNKKLYRIAKAAGWEIVVERKDVIYRIS